MAPETPAQGASSPEILTFRFRYFKGFADAELRLAEPLTLLIGRNGAGKSNTLEGIHLLSHLANGLPLSDVTDLDQGGPCEIRGGLDGCVMLGENFFVLGCELRDAKYELAVRPDPGELESELFENRRDRTLSFRSERWPGIDARVIVAGTRSARPSPAEWDSAYLPHHQNPGTVMIDEVDLSRPGPEDPVDARALADVLSDIYIMDPQPRALRRYSRAGAVGRRPLNRDGHNLAAVLYELKALRGPEALRPIVELLRKVPEERFADLDFVVAEKTRDVLLALKREDGKLVDARVLSDGTLRLMAVLAALETLPPGSLLLLEDYDGGLHPSRVKLLTTAIWERARMHGLRILATTHNPAALSSLTADQLRGVVVCHYDQQAGASRLSPLLQLPDADLLLSEGPLGELATNNRIEPYLDPAHAEKRRDAALKWLETL